MACLCAFIFTQTFIQNILLKYILVVKKSFLKQLQCELEVFSDEIVMNWWVFKGYWRRLLVWAGGCFVMFSETIEMKWFFILFEAIIMDEWVM